MTNISQCFKNIFGIRFNPCFVNNYDFFFFFVFQVLVGETAVPAIHRLEQVSTEEKVGSLAENLMEALREHPDVEKKVI